ncbi:thioredoxin family protein [Anoxynatronum buryatiense]|uniref:Thioredoxin domain-containing protein n=1 Tax=Anoxynatronum buryatiense TaxID=489973 RepID=A0AA45WTQ9_9CLOT|nr:thioredoxin family protein [Anoxynatronum buryatiense]SMP43828.1 Thioredoxin domain-containing protein [Anoxynatronum buryatiense]
MKPVVDEALRRLQLKASVTLVCSLAVIEKDGIQSLPALFVNRQLVAAGHVPSIFTMPDLLKKAVNEQQHL